jgi:hypothetical protein
VRPRPGEISAVVQTVALFGYWRLMVRLMRYPVDINYYNCHPFDQNRVGPNG